MTHLEILLVIFFVGISNVTYTSDKRIIFKSDDCYQYYALRHVQDNNTNECTHVYGDVINKNYKYENTHVCLCKNTWSVLTMPLLKIKHICRRLFVRKL